jgi:hypothetical protein
VATEEQGLHLDVAMVLLPFCWILYSQPPPQLGLPVALQEGALNESFVQLEGVLSAINKWKNK